MTREEAETKYAEEYKETEDGLVKDSYPQEVINNFKKEVIVRLMQGKNPSGPAIFILVMVGSRPKNHYKKGGVKFVT